MITSKVRDLSVIRIIEIIFIILSSYGFFLSVSKISYFELNENQVLYLYSTGAQVIAGLFGLTLAGYIFFNDRLEKEVQADESLYDAVETLKRIITGLLKNGSNVYMFSRCMYGKHCVVI